jgi:hypothetical protein
MWRFNLIIAGIVRLWPSRQLKVASGMHVRKPAILGSILATAASRKTPGLSQPQTRMLRGNVLRMAKLHKRKADQSHAACAKWTHTELSLLYACHGT